MAQYPPYGQPPPYGYPQAPPPPPPTLEEVAKVALEHLRLQVADMGDEQRAVRSLRGQLACYFKGFPNAARAREQLCAAGSTADVEAVLAGLVQKAHCQRLGTVERTPPQAGNVYAGENRRR